MYFWFAEDVRSNKADKFLNNGYEFVKHTVFFQNLKFKRQELTGPDILPLK